MLPEWPSDRRPRRVTAAKSFLLGRPAAWAGLTSGPVVEPIRQSRSSRLAKEGTA